MATITTSQTFDSTPRTAGETFIINSGAIFTIDSDTRDGKNSAVSRTGSMGSYTMTATSGGQILIDGTKVWIIDYDGRIGTPNVPSLGTIIEGVTSGAIGELMNISSTISTIPTAAGVAMPATGIIKLKNVVGSFIDNETLRIQSSTNLCLANGIGQRGWIEVVMDDTATFTIGRAQNFTITGDWFVSKDSGSGSAHQQVQFPNYGGANFFLPGVWVDELVNGNWEFWPACIQGTGTFWSAANMIAEEKNKFCECLGGGIIRFGGNGTTAWGKIPTAGAKFRIPNVLLKSAATASRSSDSVPNATLATRPDFTMTSAGSIDIDGAIGHWQILSSQAYSIKLKRLALFDSYNISETAVALDINDCHNGNYIIAQDAAAFTLANNYAGGTINNCKFGRTGTIGASDYSWNITYCNNITFNNCHFQGRTLRTNSGAYVGNWQFCDGLIFNNCITVNCGMLIQNSTNIKLYNQQYADNYAGISSVTNAPLGAIVLINSNGILIDGFSWYTSVNNQHPDTAIVYCSFTQNLKVRNIGTFASPLTAGSSNAMLYFCNDAGNSYNLEFKRIYLNLIATTFYNGVNSTKKLEITNCNGNTTVYKNLVAGALDLIVKNCSHLGSGFAVVPASLLSIYGSMFAHIFTSSTQGRLQWLFNEDSTTNSNYITKSFTTSSVGTSGFNSNGGVALINSGDYIICEFPYTIIGIDSFNNTAPTITTATNMLTEYSINTGTGYTSWKVFNASNLSNELVSSVNGFNFKIRITATSTSATNLVTFVSCITNSNSTAQALQYPLDIISTSLKLTGLQLNTEIRIYRVSDGVELAGIENSSTSFTYNYDWVSDVNINIVIHNVDYNYIYIPNITLTSSGLDIPIQQTVDRWYSNPI